MTELSDKVPRRADVLWTVIVALGCSPAGYTVSEPSRLRYREVEVDRTIVSSKEALTAFELLVRGKRYLSQGAAREAGLDLDLVVAQDPTGPWVAEALYYGAHAHEELLDHAGAASRFERLGRDFGRSEFARDAHLRALRLRVYLEHWALAGALARDFMRMYPQRAPREELVVRGAVALALLEASSPPADAQSAALVHVNEARRVIARYELDGAGHIPRDLAQVYFAWGELKRLEGEAVTFNPLPNDFATELERRAQLLLDAQRAYSDVMRAHDAHWTAMAGYRVGELYQRLHQDLMSAPRPAGADTERRKLVFEAAIRLRYTVLLKKGLGLIEHTLAMADRTGETSAWVDKARAARQQLVEAYAQEQAAVDASPYTKEDMERTLAELQKR
jgi:hypothetical protein